MNKEALRQFLVDSNKAGYAGGEEKKWIKELGRLVYKANYIGGLVDQRRGV
ncbi:MAG: hypothetical protein HYU80_00330 [Candidatus Blackburnbacteria bacterium]|nr:hypothetical protein [Candidatus Blackburnbacteria bacterium]